MLKKILSYLLFPLTYLYRFLFYLDQKFTTRNNLPNAKTISIGNLSLGGTGKTPFTMYLLNKLHNLNYKNLVVLSRGYGGSKTNLGMEVTENSTPQECGDEPKIIQKNHPFCRVLIGKDRFSTFQKFIPKDQKSIVLLDDGFQHHKLNRDYDFVLIDSENLLGNGFTIPAGYLRETRNALRRAHSVVFTKVEDIQDSKLSKFRNQLQIDFPHLEIFHFQYVPVSLANSLGEKIPLDRINRKKIFAFCGIGNSDSFLKNFKNFHPSFLEKKIFIDHHPYNQSDIDLFLSLENQFDYFICTEKDYTKLQSIQIFPKLYYLDMKSQIWEDEKMESTLHSILQS
jgi:tetraacyldisaccharide 4'-kinase